MRVLLIVLAFVEIPAGAALLLAPSPAVVLLLGSAPDPALGVTLAQTLGVALLSLGLACWLVREEDAAARAIVAAMLFYNGAIALLAASAWLGGESSGILPWPAVLLHLSLAIWCVACLRIRPVVTAA